MSKSVLYEQDKRIVKITLNRPDTRNALSGDIIEELVEYLNCLLYTSPSPRDVEESRMPSSA